MGIYHSFHKARVNVICPTDGWILNRMGIELKQRLPYVALNAPNKNNYEINYYINHSTFKEASMRVDIAFFAHVEEDNPILRDRFFKVADSVQACVCHSNKYAQILKKYGKRNVTVITPGVDSAFKPKLILGFIGRSYRNWSIEKWRTDRKGERLLDELKKLDYVELRVTDGKLPAGELPNFYRELDYVIIASKYEAGPMCLIESLACGIEVIAPKDVGMVAEFKEGIHHYENSDFNSLNRLLNELYKNKITIRSQVEQYTWDRFASEHNKFFKNYSGLYLRL